MALQGTHIRFALDLKEKYQVENLEKYIVGCTYPDTRYMTKIKRELTHPADYRQWDLKEKDDFEKGWYSHLLADDLQNISFRQHFPEIFEGEEIHAGSETWIAVTALKALQDMDDVGKFDIVGNLANLEAIEARNNEDPNILKAFYQMLNDSYKTNHPSIDDYYKGWKTLGMDNQLANAIYGKTTQFMADENSMGKIREIYPSMIKRALEI